MPKSIVIDRSVVEPGSTTAMYGQRIVDQVEERRRSCDLKATLVKRVSAAEANHVIFDGEAEWDSFGKAAPTSVMTIEGKVVCCKPVSLIAPSKIYFGAATVVFGAYEDSDDGLDSRLTIEFFLKEDDTKLPLESMFDVTVVYRPNDYDNMN